MPGLRGRARASSSAARRAALPRQWSATARLLALLPGVIALPAASYAAPPQSTDWMRNAGYGVAVHWTSQSLPASGGSAAAYCAAVSAFDVQAFASQLQEAGAGYVLFTISHAQQFFAFPSAKLDSVIASRTCSRDLYADLHAALAPKGIRMMFYYPSIGTDEDPAWRDASRYKTDPAYFAQLQYDLTDEIGQRYGAKLSGWWVDNSFDGSYGAKYNFSTYAAKLRSGNAARLVGFNFSSVGQWQSQTGAGIADYQAGEEDDIQRVPASRYAGEGGTQWQALSWMDDFWVHNSAGTPKPRYGDSVVDVYVRNVMNGEGAFTYNAAPFQDTLISAPTMRQLKALRLAVHANKIDDRDPRIRYAGAWNQASSTNYSGGTGSWTTSPGASAEYSFTGTTIRLYGVVGPDHGSVDVSVDGAAQGNIDLYAPYWSANTVVFYKNGLSSGTHTVRLTASSQRNPIATGDYVELDAVEANSGVPMLTDDRASGIAYQGNWQQTSGSAYSAGTGTFTTTAGASASFTFQGTSVRWYGVIGPDHGRSDVYIDGVLATTVDGYNANWTANALMVSRGGLDFGNHTIKIVTRSERNPAATNNYVEVDAIEAE